MTKRKKSMDRICLPLYEGVDWNESYSQYAEMLAESPSLRGSGLKYHWWFWTTWNWSRLPLYEGVDWNQNAIWEWSARTSLPLYEGVDWNDPIITRIYQKDVSLFTREWIEILDFCQIPYCPEVSLFTREWIEIPVLLCTPFSEQNVSLFTREWIEMFGAFNTDWMFPTSPSLRGSGLKCVNKKFVSSHSGLPLYEGVDWNLNIWFGRIQTTGSPSLRGSGLKLSNSLTNASASSRLPLYEGVDWNIQYLCDCSAWNVSPSLRGSGLKWKDPYSEPKILGLPLYEGVDWNFVGTGVCLDGFSLPLYEGVDWNPKQTGFFGLQAVSPSLRGSGLKSQRPTILQCYIMSPSLRGSGLKLL